MKLLLKLFNTSAPSAEYLLTYYSNYQKKFATDSGIDLIVPENYTCPPHQTTTIHLGICCAPVISQQAIPTGYYLYPRSSLANTPLRLANSVGIIDVSYRGEIMAKVDNISDQPYIIETRAGVIKLFQLCAPDLSPLTFSLVASLDATERGSGGFGSTNN